MTVRRAGLLGTLAWLLVAAACGGGSDGGGDPNPGIPAGTPAPDFSLEDVNPSSATYQTDVSPRQKLGQVSAWYFGHAT
jgi:hypothetical protein